MKSESEVWKNQLRRCECRKIQAMYLLRAGNDTVPISLRRGERVRSTEGPLVVLIVARVTFVLSRQPQSLVMD